MSLRSITLPNYCALLVLATSLAGFRTAAAEDASAFQKTVEPFLKQHCYACHGETKQEGLIRYDRLDGFAVEDQHLWTMVHEKLSAGEMPPEDRPQPSAEDKKQILGWIEAQQRSLGTGSMRRLNRRELSAALQDLTGLPIDYAYALPGDGKLDGFDTGASALKDAGASINQVLRVTRRAVDAIRFLEPEPGQSFTANLREVKDARRAFDSWKDAGGYAKVRGKHKQGEGLYLEPKWVGERGGFDMAVPPPEGQHGVIRVKLVVSQYKAFDGMPNPHLWVEIGGRTLDHVEITGSLDQPQKLVYVVQIDDLAVGKRGLGVELDTKVEMPYAVQGFKNEDKTKPDEKIPGGPGLFRPEYDRRKSPPEKTPAPFVVLQSVEIDPNYVAAWPPEKWKADLGEINDDEDSAKKLLSLWINRAWRRPVTDEEMQRFFALYQKLRAGGMSFDQSLRAAFHSVTLSPTFRYLASPADDDPVIGQHAIASRLAFMLVGAPRDGEVRDLAAAGKLREPAVLDAQVDRLISDSRSRAFVQPFVMQWLEMDQPLTVVMDYFSQQDFRFGRHLKDSMREETLQYVHRVLQDNRPARELVDSDWTMMNNSLAWHYGYEGIEGAKLRKVPLKEDDPRGGGVLSHAGIQSMLTWMGENWVIYRGAWTLRHILDDPPSPPPLEVPELNPSAGENRGKTFKELLKQHQEDSRCSVCHRKMDPLGFAFQNFDLAGRWRDKEYEKYKREELDGKIAWRGDGKSRPVDVMGAMPRGEEFQSYQEFKRLLVDNYQDDLVRGLLKKLMLYATGRKPDVDDLAEIRTIMKEEERQGYRMRNLVKAVLRSKAFLQH